MRPCVALDKSEIANTDWREARDQDTSMWKSRIPLIFGADSNKKVQRQWNPLRVANLKKDYCFQSIRPLLPALLKNWLAFQTFINKQAMPCFTIAEHLVTHIMSVELAELQHNNIKFERTSSHCPWPTWDFITQMKRTLHIDIPHLVCLATGHWHNTSWRKALRIVSKPLGLQLLWQTRGSKCIMVYTLSLIFSRHV